MGVVSFAKGRTREARPYLRAICGDIVSKKSHGLGDEIQVDASFCTGTQLVCGSNFGIAERRGAVLIGVVSLGKGRTQEKSPGLCVDFRDINSKECH